jgi:hypothetical protein
MQEQPWIMAGIMLWAFDRAISTQMEQSNFLWNNVAQILQNALDQQDKASSCWEILDEEEDSEMSTYLHAEEL